jgi:hypothetical protein
MGAPIVQAVFVIVLVVQFGTHHFLYVPRQAVDNDKLSKTFPNSFFLRFLSNELTLRIYKNISL